MFQWATPSGLEEQASGKEEAFQLAESVLGLMIHMQRGKKHKEEKVRF